MGEQRTAEETATQEHIWSPMRCRIAQGGYSGQLGPCMRLLVLTVLFELPFALLVLQGVKKGARYREK